MKKVFFPALFIVILGLIVPARAFAYGMMGDEKSSADSAAVSEQQQEEHEGKQFLDRLKNKDIECSKIRDADFEKIGEYAMGQFVGDTPRHLAMNGMMKSMMGNSGEEQAHIAMGKRTSGCEPNAPLPQGMTGGGMMDMMMGGRNSTVEDFDAGSMTQLFLFGALLAVAMSVLIWWTVNQKKRRETRESAGDILKKRYARGEIDKKEFEEKKQICS